MRTKCQCRALQNDVLLASGRKKTLHRPKTSTVSIGGASPRNVLLPRLRRPAPRGSTNRVLSHTSRLRGGRDKEEQGKNKRGELTYLDEEAATKEGGEVFCEQRLKDTSREGKKKFSSYLLSVFPLKWRNYAFLFFLFLCSPRKQGTGKKKNKNSPLPLWVLLPRFKKERERERERKENEQDEKAPAFSLPLSAFSPQRGESDTRALVLSPRAMISSVKVKTFAKKKKTPTFSS